MGQVITIGTSAFKKQTDEKLSNFIEENKEVMEKNKQLQPCLNHDTGNYFLKYTVYNVENLIAELSSLAPLTKELIMVNIKRYGYEVETEYILNCLGYSLKRKNKIKITKSVQKQAELFSFLYKINKECFIRLRNRLSGEYRAYNVESLKDPYKLQAILKSHYFVNNMDIMYSLNCYNNMYNGSENSLFSFQNIAIDVDFNKEQYTLKQALKLVKSYMGTKIPTATMIEYGHRIRLVYSLEDVPVTKKSLNVYKLVAQQIADKLEEGLGATPQPPTTYARIEGSINSKDGSKISTVIFNPVVYKLRDLQQQLLPAWEKKVKKANKKVVYMPNAYQLNLDRLSDLEKIQSIRPDDKELLCYLYRNYCLLANMTKEEAWEKTLEFNNKFPKPKRPNKLDGETKTLNRKQYLHKNETILKLLDITKREEELLNLKTIFSTEEAKRRDRVYQKNRYKDNRHLKIEKAKKLYKDKLKEEGKKSKKEELQEIRKKIKALKDKGFKNKDIAQELHLTVKTLERHITYMRKNGLL